MNKPVRCQTVKEQIASRENILLILVSEDCPFCKEVLDNLHNLDLAFDTLVVNTDACGEDIETIIDWPAVPMIVHFHHGMEVGRGVGVEGIMSFTSSGGAADAEISNRASEGPQSLMPGSRRVRDEDALVEEIIMAG